jgi:hypothetical protein
MARVTRGKGVNWPQSSINWALLGIHQQWIDEAPPEELDAARKRHAQTSIACPRFLSFSK